MNMNSAFPRLLFLAALAVAIALLASACNRPAEATVVPADTQVPTEAPVAEPPVIQPVIVVPSEAVGVALTLSNPGDSGVFLFTDDFQDGTPDNWETTGAWYVVQSGDVYVFGATGQGGAWVPSGHNWRNYYFHAGVRIDSGALFLSINLTQEGRYLLRLDPDAVYLFKEQPAENFVQLAQTGPLSTGVGHSVVIATQNGHIQVYVNKQLWIDYMDTAPITTGTIGVSSLEGSRVGVDNIYVLQISGNLPAGSVVAPAVTVVEPITVEEVAAEAAELPIVDVEPEEEPEVVVEEGALPDLVADGVIFTPAPVVQGQPFQAVFYVSNFGNAPAGAFTARLHFHAATGVPDCNADFPVMQPGETQFAFCNQVTNADPGTSPTEYTVDIEEEIAESDETNNLQTPIFEVVAGDQGNGDEDEPNDDGGGPLASPVDCAAEALSTTEVRISWNVPGDLTGQLGFRVYQAVDSLERELSDPIFRSVVIDNLAPSTQYHFDVRAYNAAIESARDACFVDVTTLQ